MLVRSVTRAGVKPLPRELGLTCRQVSSAHCDLSSRHCVPSAGRRELSTDRPGPLLRGVFVPLVTPFTGPRQAIDYDAVRHNLQIYEKSGVTGYLVGGSNGESPYLMPNEKIELVRFIRELTTKPVIAGSTAESTKACCELTKAVADAGADAALIMPPFYFRKRMTEEAIIGHYTAVADTVGLPIVIYNNPMVSGIDISTDIQAKLAQHPFISAVKDSDVRKCANTVIKTKNHNFDVLVGSAGYLLPGLVNGCSGGINGLAGILPKEVSDIFHLFNQGQLKEAASLQQRLCPPDTLLLAELGVPALKHAMDLLGFKGGLCRKPILPPTETHKKMIAESLRNAGIL